VTGYLSILKNSNLIQGLLVICVSLIILFYLSLFFSNLGTIFYFVDTVNNIHWNTWAKDFANNILPQQSHHFPQLLPANWSIAYLLTGNSEINFFAKSIMPLFIFSNLLMFLDIAISKKNLIFLIALIIYGFLAPVIFSLVFLADGNADIPVAFYSFLTFYVYLKTEKDNYNIGEQLLIFLFAACAAATKLAGIYVFVIASLIGLYGLIKHWGHIKKSDFILISILVPFILGICFFWHLLKPDVMYTSLHQPQYVGEDYVAIFIKAAKLIYFNWGLPVVAFLIITITASLFRKESRNAALTFVIPPLIIWMLKYSVDFRNLSFVIPFMSYVSAFGLFKLIEKIKENTLNINFDLHPEYSVQLKKRIIKSGIFITSLIALYFFISSDLFYNLLFKFYKFISVYYFQSHRINLLIDYSPLVNVDYYQNVFSVMVLIILGIILLYLSKARLKHFFIGSVFTILLLNFTYASEASIIRYYKKLTERVEARNYSMWLETIIKSKRMESKIYTNYESISIEKIPVELNFVYLDSDQLEKYFIREEPGVLYFLKLNLLNEQMEQYIENNITLKKYESLFSDDNYIFLSK
jgi:hypothetical protein